MRESPLGARVYRAKAGPTPFAARQIVSHGHVKGNGRRVTVASYQVQEKDAIELCPKAKEMALILEAQGLTERDVPEYVAIDGPKATYVRVPTLDEVPYPVKMEPNLVGGFYSR